MAPKRIAILGGGNMGEAIAKGLRDSRGTLVIAPGDIVIAEPDVGRHERLGAGNHCVVVKTGKHAMEMLAPDGIVVVAVKPQVFPALADEIRGLTGQRLVVSIMAGKTAAQVHTGMGGACRVVRAMPNLPMTTGDGMTGVCPGPGALKPDLALTIDLFQQLGECIEIAESQMDAFTALAASGPAYIAYFAEAMVRAGIATGFAPELAWHIVRQTIWGAARLLSNEVSGPETLRARVTSRGGTTAAAVAVLDAAHVSEVVVRAVTAARDRGRELSKS